MTVNVVGSPVQPLALAVTCTVATSGEVPGLAAVKALMLPLPLVPKPTSAVLVHEMLAPLTELVKLRAGA